jgi:hypothetical protein
MRPATLTATLLIVTAASAQAQLCDPSPDSLGRFAVREGQLTPEAAARGFAYLTERIPAVLKSAKSIDTFRHDAAYYIGYYNSLTSLEGYRLKLEALLAQSQLGAAEVALQQRGGSDSAVVVARRRLEGAKVALCEFLASHAWRD